MWTATFWKDLAERAIATFAQSLVAVLVIVEGGLFGVDWSQGLAVAGLAALIAILKGIAASYVGEKGTAALLPAPDGS